MSKDTKDLKASCPQEDIEGFGMALSEASDLRAGMAVMSAEASRLQNLICAGIPIYNIFAALYSLPPLPLPAFCNTPTPTPTP